MTTELPHAQQALARRIRDALVVHASVREVRMFGGLAFLVDDALAVSAGSDGSLLVRTDPARYEEYLDSGAEPAMMGAGRPMGEGWVSVPAERLAADADLARWIEVGIDARRGTS